MKLDGLIVNCRGPHADGFGVNLKVPTGSTEPARCPDCGADESSGKLRVLTTY